MAKAEKGDMRMGTLAAAIVIAAYACRFPDLPVLRVVLYILLYTGWGVTVYYRILNVQVRGYLMSITLLIVFWLAVRMVKFQWITSQDTVRFLWYLYYIPMLFIPLAAVFLSFSVGATENYRMPKAAYFLYVPAVLLLVLVLTNDMHQLVFRFPTAFHDPDNYTYGAGFSIVSAWMGLCWLSFVLLLLRKARTPQKTRGALLALVPAGLYIIYSVLYILRWPPLFKYLNDMTVVVCLVVMATFETLMRYELIQTNTHYMDIFRCATLNAQITDKDYNIRYATGDMVYADEAGLRGTEKGPVVISRDERLLGAPISSGYVLWRENVGAIIDYTQQVESLNEQLEDRGIAAREAYETLREKLRLEEANRLYNLMQLHTAGKIHRLTELKEGLGRADDPAKERALLFSMMLIAVYVKRCNNLVFVAQENRMIPKDELYMAIHESLHTLGVRDISAYESVALQGPVSLDNAMALYDALETVLEAACAGLESIFVGLSQDDVYYRLDISVRCRDDLACLASAGLTVIVEDEDEWSLRLALPVKGGGMI